MAFDLLCLLFLALGIAMFREAFLGITRGVVRAQSTYERSGQPARFWISVVVMFVYSICMFLAITAVLLMHFFGEP